MRKMLMLSMAILVCSCDSSTDWQNGKSQQEIQIRKEFGASVYDTCMYMMTLFTQTGVGVYHKERCLCMADYSMKYATYEEMNEQTRTKAFMGAAGAMDNCK